MSARRVVVVGGGVTGLATAHRLLALSQAQGAGPIHVTVLEARAELGGNIRTEQRDGFVVEAGPDSFVVAKPQALELCREVGLGDRLVDTRAENRKVYVRRDGVLHALPEGVVLTIPTRVAPLLASPLVSLRGKLRMALDLAIPRRRSSDDESLGAFLRRRLGDEALERLAEPLLGGIYAGDIDTLSARATFPQLVDFEVKHGSLIRGAIAQRRAMSRRTGRAPSAFASLRGGMQELIDALAASIRRQGGDIRVGADVTAIERGDADRFNVRARTSSGDIALPASHVVMTSYAYAAADALRSLDPEIARLLAGIPYASSATVSFAFDRAEIAHPLDAFGVIVPKGERRRILAATFNSSKWDHRAPSGKVLMRVFLGGLRDPEAIVGSDADLVRLAREELTAVFGWRAEPLFARVFRFDRAGPQPLVGHTARVRAIRGRASTTPGLLFAGAAYDGVGIPDCVRQANEVATRIARELAAAR